MSCRLSRKIVPNHYSLEYHDIHLDTCVFHGVVTIDAEVTEATNIVTLHALELEIVQAFVCQENKKHKASGVFIDFNEHTASLHFQHDLHLGPVTFTIHFNGTLNDKLAGLYRSSYESGGVKRAMAVTQFEATDARRAFPCWDEPSFKATFELKVHTDFDRTAISNTPVIYTNSYSKKMPDGNTRRMKEWHFDRTPIMSTYLLALVIGEFDVVSERMNNGIVVSVYTPLGKTSQGTFALKVAVKSLECFHELYQIPYPLAKVDMLAIPDFAAGAMENWGCITYREARLLVDEKNSSSTAKLNIARVVCHELAHQWFGNLVTMEWWTHLWLNEGFARYMEFSATDYVFPEWDVWTNFFDVYNTALALDSLHSSHPVEVQINHPKEIDQIFDNISYAKGASIIRMLCSFLGKENFLSGLRQYLNDHSYRNTETVDLWRAFENVSGIPVEEMMHKWTCSMGYPVLVIEKTQDGIINVRQEKFLLGSPTGEIGEWQIPIRIKAGGNFSKALVLKPGEEGELIELVTHLEANGQWFILNADQTGFYRVSYTSEQWARLADVMGESGASLNSDSSLLSVVERKGILGDSFAFSRSGRGSVGSFLNIVEKMKGEQHPAVLEHLLDCLSYLLTLYSSLNQNNSIHPIFQRISILICEIALPIFHRLGFDAQSGEQNQVSNLRAKTISILNSINCAESIQETLKRFNAYIRDSKANPISADLRECIYSCGVVQNGEFGYNAIFDLLRKSDLHEERLRCIGALSRSPDPVLLRKTIDFALSPEFRSQDLHLVLRPMCATALGSTVVWEVLMHRWGEFVQRYTGTFLLWGFMLGTVVNSPSFTNEKIAIINQFFDDPAREGELIGAEKQLSQAREALRDKVFELERDVAALS